MEITTEITLMDNRLSTMEDKLAEMEEKIDSIDKKLNQVVEALVGNKLTQNGGLVKDLQDIKTKVDKHEELAKKLRWSWAVVIGVAAFIVLVIKLIILYF